MSRAGVASAVDPLTQPGVRKYNFADDIDGALANTYATPFLAQINARDYYFHSLEHYFQFSKRLTRGAANVDGAEDLNRRILEARSNADAKALGATHEYTLRGAEDASYAQTLGGIPALQNNDFLGSRDFKRLIRDGGVPGLVVQNLPTSERFNLQNPQQFAAVREGLIQKETIKIPYKMMVMGMMMKLSQNYQIYESLKASIEAENGKPENPDLFIENAAGRDPYWGYPGLNLQGRALKDAMKRLIVLRRFPGLELGIVAGIASNSNLKKALDDSSQPLPDLLPKDLVMGSTFFSQDLGQFTGAFEKVVGARPGEVEKVGQFKETFKKLAAVSPTRPTTRMPTPPVAPTTHPVAARRGASSIPTTPAAASPTQQKPAPSEEKRMRELAKKITDAASLTGENLREKLKELLGGEKDAEDFENLLLCLGKGARSNDEIEKMANLLGLKIKSPTNPSNSIEWVQSLSSSTAVDDKRRYLAQRVMMNIVGEGVKKKSHDSAFMEKYDPKNLSSKDKPNLIDFYHLARFEEYKAKKPHLKNVSYDEFVKLMDRLVEHDLTPDNRHLKPQRLLASFTQSSAVDGKMSGAYAELASFMTRGDLGENTVQKLLSLDEKDLFAKIEAAREAQLAKAQAVGADFLARQEFAANKRLLDSRKVKGGKVEWQVEEAEEINESQDGLKEIKNSPDLKEDGIRNSPYFNQASIPQVVGDKVKEHRTLGIINIFQGDEGLSSLTNQVAEACEVERKPDDQPLVSLAFLEGITRDGRKEDKCAIITQTKRGTTTTFVDPKVFQNSILPEYSENYAAVLSHISTVESVREISDILIVAGREIVNIEIQNFQKAIDDVAQEIRGEKAAASEEEIQKEIAEQRKESTERKELAGQSILRPYKDLSAKLAKLMEGAEFKADDAIEQKASKMRALQDKSEGLKQAIAEVKKFLEESKKEEEEDKAKVPLLEGDRKRLEQLIEIFEGKKATKVQKQKALEESSHQMRHLMAARVEQSIEDANFRYSLNSNEEAEIHAQFLERDKKFDAKKGLSKLLEAPLPHSPIPDSTSILHPAGHPKTATVTFNGKGDNTAYVYLNGSPSCYLRARRCDSNGEIMVWRDGVQVLEDHKVGDVVIDSGVVFHKKRDGSFCPLSTKNPRLSTSELTEIFGKKVGDEVRKMHDEYSVKAVSLVNGDARSVAVLHQGHSAATELSAKASPYRPTKTTPQSVAADPSVQINLDKDEPIYDEKTKLFVGDDPKEIDAGIAHPFRLLRLQELDAKTKTKIAVGLTAANSGVHIHRDEAVIMQDGEVLGGLSRNKESESMDLLRRLYPGKDDEFIKRKLTATLKIVEESTVTYRVRDQNGEERYKTDSPKKEISARGKDVESPAEPPSTSFRAKSCTRLPEILQRAARVA